MYTITQCSEIQKESENFEMRGFPQKSPKVDNLEQTFVKMKKKKISEDVDLSLCHHHWFFDF